MHNKGGLTLFVSVPKLFRRSGFPIVITSDNPIAAGQRIGLKKPKAASGTRILKLELAWHVKEVIQPDRSANLNIPKLRAFLRSDPSRDPSRDHYLDLPSWSPGSFLSDDLKATTAGLCSQILQALIFGWL